MKKIIALALTAAMAMPCAVNAQAADRISGISDALSNRDEIHILYNDKVVQYEDVKPVNTDGRVMIPFRAALENMGATVDYNEAERLVTAKKGDITINFTLMDDTIYIDKNGQQSTITMDVPMIIVDDRTLVPIRFMSNAFDMQVGWDGNSETVVIMDYDDYFDRFAENAPNMTKLTTLEQPDLNRGNTVFDTSITYGDAESSFDLAASGEADSTYADKTGSASVTLNANGGGASLQDVTVDAVVKDSQLYIKTDAVEQLKQNSTSEELKLVLAALNANTWYKIDLNKVIDGIDLPDETKAVLKTALAISQGKTENTAEILKSGISTEGDADFNSVVMLAAQLDMYEEMDKYISVTEKDNGGYTIGINITAEDYNKIIIDTLGSMMTEEERSQLADTTKFSVSANTDFDGQKAVSDATVDMNINADGVTVGLKLTINETQEKDDSVKAATIPENSMDITDLIVNAMK